MLSTNFLYPSSIDLITPRATVTSGDFFFPSFTTTTRSESKSYAKPIFFVFLISSSRLSDVGSGPLDDVIMFSFIEFTLQPIFSSNVFAKLFAAPPPTSIVTSGLLFTLPIISLAFEI